ncbi:unnamed protein product [Zymoseptoria tritici ST99CH_1A5]|uniref:Ubiquitin-like protease family profile domain-containing protein n=1 Tax=Zymoseptoria tritici ST99CH_1A5 TaxID=1276529 RepID=A0A1Y6LNV7_ZYMTR|nr:unnamed protein product [Zymoseptoria tritici ST99CH_1A5]
MAPRKKTDDDKKKQADGKAPKKDNSKKKQADGKKAPGLNLGKNLGKTNRKTRSQVRNGASPVFPTFPDEAREQRRAWEENGIRPDSKRAPDGDDADEGRPNKRPKRNPGPEKDPVTKTPVTKEPVLKKPPKKGITKTTTKGTTKGPTKVTKGTKGTTKKGPAKGPAKGPKGKPPKTGGENGGAEDDDSSEDGEPPKDPEHAAPSAPPEQTTTAPQPTSERPVSAVTQPDDASSGTTPTTSIATVPGSKPIPKELTTPTSITNTAEESSGSSKPARTPEANDNAPSGGVEPNGGVSNSNGKPPLEGNGNNSNGATQAPKPGTKGKEPAQDQAPAQTSGDPCDDLARRLQDWHDQAQRNPPSIAAVDPARWWERLRDETVMRAIYAVTEAISVNGSGVQFALARFDMFMNNSGNEQLMGTANGMVRAGNTALIPFTEERYNKKNPKIEEHHTTLFVVQPTVGAQGNFTLHHYDSADMYDEHQLAVLVGRARSNLIAFGWDRHRTNIPDGDAPRAQAMRQRNDWECGIHTVVNAWAIALGLTITRTGEQPLENARFLRRGIELINLAIQGHLDSRTIEAFLRCFELVEAGARVALARQFAATVPLPDVNVLECRIQRIRLEAELATLRQINPDIAQLDVLLNFAGVELGQTLRFTAQQLVEPWIFAGMPLASPDRSNAYVAPEELDSGERNMMAAGINTAERLQLRAQERERQRNAELTSPTPQGADMFTGGMMQAVAEASGATTVATDAQEDPESIATDGRQSSANMTTQALPQNQQPQESQVENQGATQDQIPPAPQTEADHSPADRSDDLWVSEDDEGVPSDLFEGGTMDTDIEDGPPSATLPTTPTADHGGIVLPTPPRATILLDNGELCGDQNLSPPFPRPTPPAQQSAPPAAVMVSPTTDQNPLIGQEKDGEDALAPLDQTGLSPSADEDDLADDTTFIEQGDQTMGEDELAADQERDAASDDEEEMDPDETLLEGELTYTEQHNQDEINEDREDEEEDEEEVEGGMGGMGGGFNTSAPETRYRLPAPSRSGQPVAPPSAPAEPRTVSEEAWDDAGFPGMSR